MKLNLFFLLLILGVTTDLCLGDIWNGYDPRDIFKRSDEVFKRLEAISGTDEERRCVNDFQTFAKDISLGKEWTNRSESYSYTANSLNIVPSFSN